MSRGSPWRSCALVFSSFQNGKWRPLRALNRNCLLLQTDPVKLSLVRQKVDRIGKLQNDLRKSRIETLVDGRAVLDPEQQGKLQDLVARSLADKHNAMMERFHGQARPPGEMM